MPSLVYLDISRNKIKKLPKSMGNLMMLKALNLSKNRLVELPTYISDMKQLETFVIDGNPLVYPPKSVMKKSKHMLEEDWLVRLKDWLKYEEIKGRSDEQSPMNEANEYQEGGGERVTEIAPQPFLPKF
jgi:hypothetical protein